MRVGRWKHYVSTLEDDLFEVAHFIIYLCLDSKESWSTLVVNSEIVKLRTCKGFHLQWSMKLYCVSAILFVYPVKFLMYIRTKVWDTSLWWFLLMYFYLVKFANYSFKFLSYIWSIFWRCKFSILMQKQLRKFENQNLGSIQSH